MKKDNTTPRPWNFTKTSSLSYRINGKDYSPICEDGYLPKKADAELIVTAVNSYDALLEACRNAIACLDNHIARNPQAKSELPELRAHLNKAINQATK